MRTGDVCVPVFCTGNVCVPVFFLPDFDPPLLLPYPTGTIALICFNVLIHCRKEIMAGVESSGWALVRGLCHAVQAARPQSPYPRCPRTAYTCRVKACAGCGVAPLVVRAGLRKQPETGWRQLETAGDALEMSGKMRTTGSALPHTRLGRAPARPAIVVIVVVVGVEISKPGVLSTPGAGPAPSGPDPARIANPSGGTDSHEGNPDYNCSAHAA